jgi:hypothetical protein
MDLTDSDIAGAIDIENLGTCEADGCTEDAKMITMIPLSSEITGVTALYISKLCLEHRPKDEPRETVIRKTEKLQHFRPEGREN